MNKQYSYFYQLETMFAEIDFPSSFKTSDRGKIQSNFELLLNIQLNFDLCTKIYQRQIVVRCYKISSFYCVSVYEVLSDFANLYFKKNTNIKPTQGCLF